MQMDQSTDHHFEWPFTVGDQIILNARIEAEEMLDGLEFLDKGFDWLFAKD